MYFSHNKSSFFFCVYKLGTSQNLSYFVYSALFFKYLKDLLSSLHTSWQRVNEINATICGSSKSAESTSVIRSASLLLTASASTGTVLFTFLNSANNFK